MRTITTALLVFATLLGVAQSSLIVYSPEGKKFNVMLNGVDETQSPQSNVEMHSLQPARYAMRITMEENGQVIEKSVYLEDNMEYRMEIKDKSKSGLSKGMRHVNAFLEQKEVEEEAPAEYVVRLVSQRELAGAPAPTYTEHPTTTTTVQTTVGTNTTTSHSQSESVSVSMNVSPTGASVSTTTTSTQSGGGTATSSNSVPAGGEISAQLQGQTIVLGDGRVINWKYTNISGMVGSEIEMKVPVQAQVTISYDGKQAFKSEVPFVYREKDFKKFDAYFKLSVVEANGTTWSVKMPHKKNNKVLLYSITGGGGQAVSATSSGCLAPMDPAAFSDAKGSIESKTFDDSKVQLAKQVAKSNCLSAEQVKQIMMLFTYEDDRLDFAKFAYPFTFDKGNYYKVNDAFEFELTIDELNEWLERQ